MKELLKEIRDNNVLLEVVDGQLKVFASESQIAPALIAAIRENKKELVQFLTSNNNTVEEDEYSMAIPALPGADSYQLSPAQQRLWVLSQFREGNIAYNIPGVYILEGDLNIPALEQAFQRLPERHEILRTVFREDDGGEVRQFVLPVEDTRFQLRHVDLQQETSQSQRLQVLVEEEVAQPFDLAHGPLLRGVLFRLSESKWVFATTLHHIISDAWSMGILIRELLLFYNAYAEGVEAPLPPLRIHYKDYAAWQRSQSGVAAQQDHRDYWLQQFEGELPVLALPADYPRPAVRTYNGGTVSQHISAVLTNRLQAYCQEQGATLFMGLMAVLNALFYRYTGQEDIIIGSSKSGRDHIELEDQIGFYLNTLALRNRFSGTDGFRQLLSGVRQVTLDAYEHQSYPFDKLIDELPLQRDTSRSSLFDVIVGFQQADAHPEQSRLGAVTVSRYEDWEERFNKFDFTFLFAAGADGIQVSIGYNSDIYHKDTAVRMAGHFEQLLATALAHPDTPVNELDYLGVAEKQQLLETFSHAVNGYPTEKTILDLFAVQVQKTPDAPALAFNDTVLSYRELDLKSDILASYLLTQYEIMPNDLIGIMLDRSENMIIAILGILKTGGAYVAIDPDLPKARKAFIMQDTLIRALITQTDYVFELDYYNGAVYAIDIQLDDTVIPVKPTVELHPLDLAYVLYTSGSTGQPKGVMISHCSLVDYSYGVRAVTNIGSCKTFGLVSTISADLGNTVIYTSLLMGGCLRIYSAADVMSADRLGSAPVDCLKIVPSHWKALQSTDRLFAPAKCLIFGGEQLTADVIDHIREHKGSCEVYNHYGPSETTIGKLLRRIDVAAPKISLGMPFCNSRVYVLDKQLRPCPIGVAGEICIGGDGLANGYLNQPELTAARFVPNPFVGGELFYKTGDLGRWLPDGSIAFLGRKDDQVKIRGYRIELDEITDALQQHPAVDTAVVLAWDNKLGERELAAYYVATLSLGTEELRTFLSKSLPSYMLPRYYVQLEAMPITSNGKINRKQLPDPDSNGNTDEASYIAPRNIVEVQLAEIWQEVLGKEKIGVKDNFFELGGHSLKATRLASQIHRKFNVKIDFHDLFTSTTLEEQAQLITGTQKTLFERIHSAPVQRYYPLSSSQRRLWVLSQFRESNIAYNVPGVYLFEGTPDRDALANAFDQLILRHEILRTVFREDEAGIIQQFILPAEALGFRLQYHDLRQTANQDVALQQLLQQKGGQPFDLAAGPLVRAALICLSDHQWVFTYTMHHIISDGWSTRILLKELLLFYNAFCEGEVYPALSALRIQYKDYAVWQQEQLHNGSFNAHREYWQQQFSGELPVLDLPGDHPRPAAKTYNGGTVFHKFDPAMLKALKEITTRQDASLFMGLLAAVNILLYRHSGQQDLIIGSPVAGRNHADLDDQIGLYLNTLALRTRFHATDNYQQLLANVRAITLDAYEHQSYPFDELLHDVKVSRDMSRTALFDVLIDLHNTGLDLTAEGLAAKDLSIRPFSAGSQVVSKFDLTFMFIEAGEELAISLEYNSDIYTKNTAERFCARLAVLLDAITNAPEVPLQQLDCMEEAERRQLLETFNDIPLNYTDCTDVLSSFKNCVEKYPDSIAVVFEQSQLTYAMLDQLSDQLATQLYTQYQVGAGDLAGIMLDRSDKMIIAILGILKTGAAYVPVDPTYPAARKEFIIQDTGLKILVTQTSYIFDIGYYKGDVYAIDVQLDGAAADPVVLPPATDGQQLAYVIYTSGSTGTPKGCAITRDNLAAYIQWADHYYFAGIEKPSFGLFTSLSFDLTVTSIFCSLTMGGSLHVYDQHAAMADIFTHYFSAQSSSNCIKLTPAHVSYLRHLQLVADNICCAIIGGEQVTNEQVGILKNIHPGMEVYNEYGPTETTVGCIVTALQPERPVLIGKPIARTSIYILDEVQQLVPVGVVGEIYIAGAGVASGYLHQPVLTAEKFVTSPFTGGRMYRTGDLARWLPDGNIVFIGRKDDQVKIRGYRIELGEIETAVLGCPGVEAAVVLARAGSEGEKELAAYITGKDLNVTDIRNYLSGLLPVYMIPAHFVVMEQLPLTANGKVDRKQLPDPLYTGISVGVEYVAPRTAAEIHLAAVLEEVLKKKQIGLRDDFFLLGGDSIKSIQVVSRLKQRGYSLKIQDVLLTPEVEQLAAKMETVTRYASQEMVTGLIPFTPIQHYFLEQDTDYAHHFNQSVLLHSHVAVSEESLRAALHKLWAHHDALRMVYRQEADGWVQENKGVDSAVTLEVLDYNATDFAAHCDRIQSSFQLSAGPLFKAALFRAADGDRLLLVAHHLVVDGVSWRILLEDLSELYQQHSSGAVLQLPQKTDAYAWWSEQLQAYAQSTALEAVSYWERISAVNVSPLPLDDAGGSNQVRDGASQSFLLDSAVTTQLLTRCYSAYRTEVNDILLSALGLALRQEFGLSQVLVMLEGHGREDIGGGIDVTRTIGWFTTLFPVLLELEQPDAISQLIAVKEHLHRVPAKGIGYGVQRYLGRKHREEADDQGSKKEEQRPQLSFNYLGDFGTGVGSGEGAQLFSFSGDYHGVEVAPERERSTVLSVSGMIVSGQLRMTIGYSKAQYKEDTIRRLLSVFEQQLQALIAILSASDQNYATPVDLTFKDLSRTELAALNKDGDLEDVYPLSPLQEGLYYHWQRDPGAPFYFEQMNYRLQGPLDIPALTQSYLQLVARHAVLRTHFIQRQNAQVLQVVKTNVAPVFEYIVVNDSDTSGWREADRSKGFDLHTGSQMRLTVLALGNDTYEFIWSHHHILMDGWCVGILIREFFQIYYHLLQHTMPQLPAVYPYADYIRWLTSSAQEPSLLYWKTYLSGYDTLSSVPGISEKEFGAYEGRKQHLEIAGALRHAIKNYSAQHGITENTFFQVMWGILLGRYNNTDDVIFGSIVSGRPAEIKGIEEMIGLFINTIPVRIRMDAGDTVAGLLKKVQQEAIEAVPHHQVQLAEIQRAGGPGRQLFDHVIIFENYPVQELVAAEMQTGTLELLSSAVFEQTSYDLSLVIIPGETIRIIFDYNSYCYEDALIGQLQQHLLQLIQGVMKDTAVNVHQVDYLSTGEKQQLLHAFNTVSLERLPEKTVLHLFEEQVLQRPGNTALYFDGTALNYRELNAYANQLAHYLHRQYGIGTNDRVGLHLERSEWTIVAIWAILKAGGAYVPVDPDYPAERIAHMLGDSACKVLIDAPFLQQFLDVREEYSTENLTISPAPGELAYVIYTSGSTGRSKGVQITHRNLLHSTVQRQRTYENVSSFLLLSSYAFDSSVAGIFGTLCDGGRLNMVKSTDVADIDLLADFICTQEVTHLLTVPSYYQQLLAKLAGRSNVLTQVIVAGETCTPALVDLHFATAGMEHCDLFNEYGPTECAVWSSYHQYEKGKALDTIGKPIANTRVYILDDHLQLLPVGVTGEICIGGDGLSPGYLNRPALTAEKFVEDPFCKDERMYRTGDLGKWAADGSIQFVGRKDDQVKIRGYRIELGEIEKALQGCSGVEAAVVTIRNRTGNEKELIAYITAKAPLEAAVLRTALAVQLPPYMLPAHFVQLDVFPLTPNGKVDRKHMPDPDGIAMSSGIVFTAPRNAIEMKLAAIWQEILGITQVGVLDDFFQLGGHSLKATRLAGMIHQQFDVKLRIAQLFANTVLEAQAQLIAQAQRQTFVHIEPLPAQTDYVLSAAQRRLWALSQSQEGNIGYNMPGVYRINGELDPIAWQQALHRLVARHEILRTVFRESENGEIRQVILPAETLLPDFFYEDLREASQQETILEAAIQKNTMQPFDLANGPLIRVFLYRTQDNEWVFIYVLHHIISDGWSMQVLSNELLQLYYHPALLPPLRFHYKDYAAWQQSQLEGVEVHKEYWLQQFREEVPVLALAGDKPRPPVKTYNGAAVNKRLNAKLTKALKKMLAEEGCTLFMGLLAAVNNLLYRYTHQEDIVIGSPVAGRDHIDLEKQIGFYINTLPLRTRFQGNETFRQLLRNIRAVTLGAYEHQLYPFDELVDALQLRRDVSRNPLFDVWVVLQNQDAGVYVEGPLQVSGYEAAQNLICRFDLLFNFVETGEEIHAGLLYNTDIYQESTARQLANHLEQLLEAAVAAADQPLQHLDFLEVEEKQFLLLPSGQTVQEQWADKTVIDLFEAQAALTPDRTAVVFEGQRLTYRALNETANRMAAYLRHSGDIRPDDLVAIRLERSEWMMVAMIAVMKAGAAYVPIDPEYPVERVDYMLADSQCKHCIDEHWLQSFQEAAPMYTADNLPVVCSPQHLAYVIYTSGSTGHPKGVMVTHAALVDYTTGILERTNLHECRRFGLVSTIAADLGNTVIYVSLLTGGELHLFSAAAVMNPETMQHAELDCVKIVPSHWKALQGAHHTFVPLKCLIFGGEQLTMDVIRLLQSNGATCQVYNHYGPSETTVGKLACRINIHDPHLAISLGRPFGNNYVYLLDEYLQLVPPGVTGEICIGGDGLSRGYLHRPDATTEKFVKDPFRDQARIYRTGDLGRMLPDGNIAFIGRKDDQVKIRGFRIEPGEITNILLRQEHITAAIVMAVDGPSAEKQLVAWFSAGSGFELTVLRNSLQATLPAYMIPAHFVRMDALPLTANGKIDRKGLPLPDAQNAAPVAVYVAPRTEVETQLVAIWSEVLEVDKEKVGIKDSFFDLGGHSLKAIRIVLRIHEQFNVEVDLTNFFLEPNIEALAEEIENIHWMQQ